MLKITKIYLHRLINTINNWFHGKLIKNELESDFSQVLATDCWRVPVHRTVQNQLQIYLSSAQQPSYHYGLNKIQHDKVNKKESCFDRCKIRKVQREVFTFLEKPFSRILSGTVPSVFLNARISWRKILNILGSSCGCVSFGLVSCSRSMSCCDNIFNNQGLWRNLFKCFILFGKCYFGSIFTWIYSATLVMWNSWPIQRLQRNGSDNDSLTSGETSGKSFFSRASNR